MPAGSNGGSDEKLHMADDHVQNLKENMSEDVVWATDAKVKVASDGQNEKSVV